jgi:Prokaryotic N-terminal methylation motif
MSKSRQGFTFFELMISMTLLTAFALSLSTMLQRTQDNYVATMRALELETNASLTIRRMRELLRGAGLSTVTPSLDQPNSSASIDFQRDTQGTGTWAAVERIEWRLAPGEIVDGLDSNGNGLIDDGQVVWIEDFGLPTERAHILAHGVPMLFRGELANSVDDNGNGLINETGLFFSFVEDTLRIGISLEKSDPRTGVIGTNLEVSLHLRN